MQLPGFQDEPLPEQPRPHCLVIRVYCATSGLVCAAGRHNPQLGLTCRPLTAPTAPSLPRTPVPSSDPVRSPPTGKQAGMQLHRAMSRFSDAGAPPCSSNPGKVPSASWARNRSSLLTSSDTMASAPLSPALSGLHRK